MQHCQMSVDEKEREQVFSRLLEVNLIGKELESLSTEVCVAYVANEKGV